LSREWLQVQVDELFEKECGVPFHVSNDADLAGVAEMHLGAGQGEKGVTIVITIGTGIGSGMFYNGQLIPNLEIGKMLHTNGKIIEFYTADSIRKKEELTLKQWAKRFDKLLEYSRIVFSPSLIILGGGISKKYDIFKEYLTTDIRIKVAKFRNNAGIVGAAMYCKNRMNT
jgi:polyphosphate glucokinase